MSGLGALVKMGKAARKAEPFYSAVDEAAAALTRGKGTGKEFMIEVLKKPGVKPTEIKERGLQKIEAMPKMTKEQFLEELEKRPAPQVEEKVLKDPSLRDIEDRAHQLAYDDAYDELRAEGMNRHEAEDIAAEEAENNVHRYLDQAAEELAEDSDYAAHSNYTIPGGENYREMLLKMPGFKGDKKLMELEAMRRRVDPDTNPSRHQELTQQIDALKAEKAAMPEQFKGVGAHFGGEPGILASIRVSDRTGPKGEKVLHVEEIQSDWHQQGRKKGYKEALDTEGWSVKSPNPYEPNEVIVYDQNGKAVWTGTNRFGTDRQIIENVSGKLQEDKVPDAPFKKNWHELAMKRVLNYAAENGYDRVAITPGAEQASRYNLAKQVEHITAAQEDGKFRIFARDLQGKNHDMGVFEAEQLPDVVGKDLAGKIAGQTKPTDIYEGVDLEVGGEGMRGFYDKMLPDYLNSYGKKYGAQVTPFDIETEPARIERAGVSAYQVPAKTSSLHGFDITPEMRQEITGKGLPLYQQIGIPAGGAAAGMGALEQEDQGFAVGGPVGSSYDTAPDMNDGGRVFQGTAFKNGGRVHLSQNPDTMLLDLMSRS